MPDRFSRGCFKEQEPKRETYLPILCLPKAVPKFLSTGCV